MTTTKTAAKVTVVTNQIPIKLTNFENWKRDDDGDGEEACTTTKNTRITNNINNNNTNNNKKRVTFAL